MPAFKVVIPARYGSSRLPGKPLLLLAGKPMIQHVVEAAQESGAEEIWVATDDERIAEAVNGFGGQLCMTAVGHESGTDRIAEVCAKQGWPEQTLIVNVQGDEPMMPPKLIAQVAEQLAQHPSADLSTVCCELQSNAEIADANIVKVVRDQDDFALYFSRAAVPFQRDAGEIEQWQKSAMRRHIGIYGYRAAALQRFAKLSPAPIEQLECLEQLRALYNGMRIHCADAIALPGPGVDTLADAERVEQMIVAGLETRD